MSYVTKEAVRAVRLKNSHKIVVDEFPELEFRVAKLSGQAAIEATEMQETLKKLTDKDPNFKSRQLELFKFLMKKAVVDKDGNLLTDEDVDQMMSVMSLESLSGTISKVTTTMKTPEVDAGKS